MERARRVPHNPSSAVRTTNRKGRSPVVLVCDHASNFDVLMPTMHLERLPEGVTAEPYGEVELRGFPGAIDVVRLHGAPTSVRNDTGELWTRSPLV